MDWMPCTLYGQVVQEHHKGFAGEAGYDLMYLTLAYGTNRVMLGEWADALEPDTLLEVTGALAYINDIGEFTINGPYDFSQPDGFAPPDWRAIGIYELDEAISPGFLPGVNDLHTLGDIPVMNMSCPVCRAVPGDPCYDAGYLVSHIPGEPHCHQARWDRASHSAAWGKDSDAVAGLLVKG